MNCKNCKFFPCPSAPFWREYLCPFFKPPGGHRFVYYEKYESYEKELENATIHPLPAEGVDIWNETGDSEAWFFAYPAILLPAERRVIHGFEFPAAPWIVFKPAPAARVPSVRIIPKRWAPHFILLACYVNAFSKKAIKILSAWEWKKGDNNEAR